MDTELPVDYDAIVIGTGMTGSVIAAALSRIGKNVLHIDENDFYGEEWASFNLDTISMWLNIGVNSTEVMKEDELKQHIKPTERFIPTSRNQRCTNITQMWQCPSQEAGDKNVESQVDDGVLERVDGQEEKTKLAADNSERSNQQKIWSADRLKQEYRKFNLDLSPKMLYSRGLLVELLISSNIARYADFKSVSRVLTWRENRLEVVPCSRADVFATKHVSVVHKRMLVKVLTVLAEYPNSKEEFEGFENKTFLDYLKHKKLSDQVIHYILYAIAMGSDKTPCIEGVRACQRFLQSLGRYGNTPFIFPLYGSGEMPQCFCRLCAVFGGVYHLKRAIDGYIINPENEVVAIISGGQRLNAKQFVVSSALCPTSFVEPSPKTPLTRGIFVTDRSLLESEKETLTLLQFPPLNSVDNPVTVMEMSSSCQVCPPGLFVVHMTTESEEGLKSIQTVRDLLFQTDGEGVPSVLWSLTWNMAPGSDVPTKACPPNLKFFSGPDSGLDFDGSIKKAKNIFAELCPEEEFLPRAPDPDEIVLDCAENESENDTTKDNSKEGAISAEEDHHCVTENEAKLRDSPVGTQEDEKSEKEGNLEHLVKKDDSA